MPTVLLGLLGILIVYVVFQLLYSGYYYKQGSDLAKTSYSRTTSLGSNSNPPFKLYITGDSVGAGVGATSFETSVAGRLGEYFAKDHNVEFENASVSGYKVEDVVKQTGPSNDPDLIVLIVSSNNYFRLTSLEEFKTNVTALFAKYSGLGQKVVLIGPGRVQDSTSIPFILKPIYLLQGPKYAKILKEEASKYSNVVYVDPLEHKIEDSKYGPTLAADHFHPNDSGHKYWFDLVVDSLNK